MTSALNVLFYQTQKARTREGNANSIRRPEEVLGEPGNSSTIADGDRAVISMGVVVGGLLIVLKLFNKMLILTKKRPRITRKKRARFMSGTRSITSLSALYLRRECNWTHL